VAITLALFKMYQEHPKQFNKKYMAFLSAGSTRTTSQKLKKFFGVEINKNLFEDAMI
jgi:oligoendopeptidase F